MTTFNEADYTFKAAMDADELLSRFGANALLVFGLSLYVRAEDVEELAAESLTDGGNDKKVDACHLDLAEGRAVVVQAYCSETWGRTAAKANKASDLNTAMTWLLAASEDDIPERIKVKAMELRGAIAAGDLNRIDILYIHNCFESENVAEELKAVANATKGHLESLRAGDVSVVCRELGLDAIEELYRSRDRDILVEGRLVVPGAVLREEKGQDWEAVVVTVSGDWIRNLYAQYGNNLFSANLRDFLGVTGRNRNINAGIKQTAASEPENFWVYNNGITALTHEICREGDDLLMRGISIINGAQTSGALGECEEAEAAAAKVLCRIVKCDRPEIVHKIIHYNNTQNAIRPFDLRSRDSTQKRLGEQFDELGITYVHRRSGPRSPRNAISAESIGVALCAFHGDMQTAARNRRDIFLSDSVYEKVFPSRMAAEHVFLVHSLATALDALKLDLKSRVSSGEATDIDGQQYEALRFSMSKHFILYVVGLAAEELVGARIADRYEWKALRKMIAANGNQMRGCWLKALRAVLPPVSMFIQKEGDAYDVTRATDKAKNVGESLRTYLASLGEDMAKRFADLREATEW